MPRQSSGKLPEMAAISLPAPFFTEPVMSPRFVTRTVFCFLAAAVVAGPLAAQDVLSAVPDNVLGVAVVQRLSQTSEKASKLAEKLKLPLPNALDLAKARLGIEKGIDEKGSLALAAVPGDGPNDEPIPLLFVPTNDYDALIKQLNPEKEENGITTISIDGDRSIVAKKGNFAVISARSGAAKALRAALDAKSSVADGLKPMQGWVNEADACAIATPTGIKIGAAKAAQALAEVREQLGALGGEQAEMAKAMFSTYEKLIKACPSEVSYAAAAVRVEAGGDVHFGSRLLFTAEGSAVKQVATLPAPVGNPLAGLPADPWVMAMAGTLSPELGNSLIDWSMQMMEAMPGGKKVEPEKIKRLGELAKEQMKGIRALSMVVGVGAEKGSIYSGTALVEKVDNAKKFLTDYAKSVNELGKLAGDIESPFIGRMTAKETTIDGTPVVEIEMQIPATAGADGLPGFEKMFENLFGPGGKMMMYVAAADDQTIVGAYVSKDLLKKAIASVRNPTASLSADAGIAKTAPLLPQGAQWVGYINPKGVVDFGVRIARLVMPDAAGFELPPFPETQPVGFAIKATKEGLETDLVLPSTVIESVYAYVMRFREL
jgi:hypothetical protein